MMIQYMVQKSSLQSPVPATKAVATAKSGVVHSDDLSLGVLNSGKQAWHQTKESDISI